MASNIKFNVKNLVDLNTIIERYEKIDPNSGKTVVSKSWKVFDGLQLNLETLKQTTDTKKLYDEFKKYIGDEIKKGSDALFDSNKEGSISKGFNDFFQGVYTPGKQVKRDAEIQIGDQKVKINGTLGGLMNSKDFGEAASLLLNDCLPCQPRADGIAFKPDLNFLDALMKPLLELIDTITSLVLTLVDTGPFKGQFCVTLNALNFVCLPDLSAINLALVKNLKLSVADLPKLTLPGLSDIALFIVMPFLTALVNLVQQWINVVMKPLQCAIQAINKQIAKFKIKTKGFDLGLTLELTKSKKLDIKSHEFNKFVNSLDTSAGIDGLIKGMSKLSTYLSNIEKSIMAWLKKNILDKFKSGMDTMSKSIKSIAAWLTKITEAANFLLMFAALKNIFFTTFEDCKDKNTTFETVKPKVAENIAALLGSSPNIKANAVNGVVSIEKNLFLTAKELEALKLKEAYPDLVVHTDMVLPGETTQSAESNLLRITIPDKIDVTDCINSNLQESFFDSSDLLHRF